MFTYINSISDLEVLNKELLHKPFLGVDTEFRRTRKDNMKLALLQINDAEEIYIIDPLLIEDPGDQCSFLFSSAVIKIFHSCKEDIEAIYSWSGGVMSNLFDTQLAEAFLNGDYSIGYQSLVEKKLGILIDKKETRSNWIRRPLTDSQLSYATSDVEFLIYLFLEQKESLIESKKLDWLNEEIDFLISDIFLSTLPIEERLTDINKTEENKVLKEFNNIVLEVSERQEINPTLFFSKKNQRNFLRLFLNYGFDEACKSITNWRFRLISEPLEALLVEYR